MLDLDISDNSKDKQNQNLCKLFPEGENENINRDIIKY